MMRAAPRALKAAPDAGTGERVQVKATNTFYALWRMLSRFLAAPVKTALYAALGAASVTLTAAGTDRVHMLTTWDGLGNLAAISFSAFVTTMVALLSNPPRPPGGERDTDRGRWE